VDAETALQMVAEVHDVVDIIEVGTPMILREGMHPVRIIKEKYPALTVLADTKIIDAGNIESADAFKAGADIVTVLAFAQDATIRAVVKTARDFGKQVMGDMVCVQDVTSRAVELDDMDVDYICLHTAIDVQNTGKTPFDELARVKMVVKKAGTAAAGGINLNTIPLAKKYQTDIVVVGTALTEASDLRAAAQEMIWTIKN
jgi:3-hexulose-6-phosphate synthase